MKVIFRADASMQIGSGHVMRCLTLAEALTASGAECHFICRTHRGNLIELIKGKGYAVHELPILDKANGGLGALVQDSGAVNPVHHHWLGATQAQDAEACTPYLAAECPDWLIVDHYALDARWERALEAYFRKLMVIDDLADRPHKCDLLLDQTYGRVDEDYRQLVPADCLLLCGSQYALLRPEFAALRPYSLQRRSRPALRELLVTMGGVDKDNATSRVLEALRTCPLPTDSRITVIMGVTAPWLDEVRKQAHDMPWITRVLVGVRDIAQLMSDCDLAVGAAGTTSWERCCLGVPTIMVVLAENQIQVAQALERGGAARGINLDQGAATQLRKLLVPLVEDPSQLLHMSKCAENIVDGLGVNAVMRKMEI
ncbi:UDP-2,4-diacetamido-2,4,6-trideoxy-beta-L-altropyranose hydrolase [uncultured Zoogloea sp.]|uniref:UDP-2,4-diacetamido-2,4, 6-trideoxy-beta-L-altropyranose hydrolase n=1 Tax=uncultured Zoogloea sp. TaxID=160237 RepID=UPI002626937E|nr:UDP-2,4-diacetamido-2,4,6-trideoxy-beta-L-altropyranose hydrolase [uncultured Zoogloea sp.]